MHHPTLTDPNCSKFLNFFKTHNICFFDKAFLQSDWQTTYLADWKKENNISDELEQKEIDDLIHNFRGSSKKLLDLVIKNDEKVTDE